MAHPVGINSLRSHSTVGKVLAAFSWLSIPANHAAGDPRSQKRVPIEGRQATPRVSRPPIPGCGGYAPDPNKEKEKKIQRLKKKISLSFPSLLALLAAPCVGRDVGTDWKACNSPMISMHMAETFAVRTTVKRFPDFWRSPKQPKRNQLHQDDEKHAQHDKQCELSRVHGDAMREGPSFFLTAMHREHWMIFNANALRHECCNC
jgi:hypothetical protein